MELPQEIELWYVVPAIRKALVTELKKHKIKQKDIAPLLGITESAVSQYMCDKRAAHCYEAFQKQPLKEEIEKAAGNILNQEHPDPAVAIREINRLCKLIRESKVICDIHRKQKKGFETCDICYGK